MPAGQYGIPPFVKLYEGGKGYILHVHTRLLLVLQLKSKFLSAGEKVSSASAALTLANFLSPALAFRH
jgi:hypothetical protein